MIDINVKALSTTQVAAPTIVEVAAFTSRQIDALNASPVDSLNLAAVFGLRRSQDGAESDKVQALSRDAMAGSKMAQCTSWAPEIVSKFKGPPVAALGTAVMNTVGPDTVAVPRGGAAANLAILQVTSLSTTQISHLSDAFMGGLGTAICTSAMTGLTPADLVVLGTTGIVAMSADQLAHLAPATIKALVTAQMQTLSTPQVAGLANAQLQQFNASQVGAIAPMAFGALTAAQVKYVIAAGITKDQISALPGVDIGALTSAQIRGLTTAAIGGLTGAQAPMLSTGDIAALTTDQVPALGTDVIVAMSKAQFSAMSLVDVRAMTSQQLAALGTTLRNKLNTQQIAAIDPATLGVNTVPFDPIEIVYDRTAADASNPLKTTRQAYFDITGTGWRQKVDWVGPGVGFMFYDPTGQGVFSSAKQLDFTNYVAGATSDLDALDKLGSPNSGVFQSTDAAWNKFFLWKDNGNALVDSGEVVSLSQAGLTSIATASYNRATYSLGANYQPKSKSLYGNPVTDSVNAMGNPVNGRMLYYTAYQVDINISTAIQNPWWPGVDQFSGKTIQWNQTLAQTVANNTVFGSRFDGGNLTPSVFAFMSTETIATITSLQIRSLTSDCIVALTSKQLRAIPTAALGGITSVSLMNGAAGEHFIKYATTNQVRALSTAGLYALDPVAAGQLDLGVLTTAQAAALFSFANQLPYLNLAKLRLDEVSELSNLGVFTAGQMSELSTAVVAALSSSQIESLNSLAVGALNTAQIRAISSDAFAGLRASQVAAFKAAQMEAIAVANVSRMSPALIAALSSACIAALSPVQVRGISLAGVRALQKWQLQGAAGQNFVGNARTDQLQALSASAISGLGSRALGLLDLSALSRTQLSGLTTAQVPLLSNAAIASLSAPQFGALGLSLSAMTTDQLMHLRAAQMGVVPVAVVGGWGSASIGSLSSQEVGGMTTSQWAALTSAGAAGLRAQQIAGITSDDVRALSTAAISGLTTDFVSALPTAHIAAMGARQIPALSPSAIGHLSTSQLEALPTSAAAVLTTAQIAGMTGAQVRAVAQAAWLGTGRLTLDMLSTSQIASFTTAQIVSMATEYGSAADMAIDAIDTKLLNAYAADNAKAKAAAGKMGKPVVLTAAIKTFIDTNFSGDILRFESVKTTGLTPQRVIDMDLGEVLFWKWKDPTNQYAFTKADVSVMQDWQVGVLAQPVPPGATLGSLHYLQVRALTVDQIRRIDPAQLGSASAQVLALFSPAQCAAFTDAQVAKLFGFTATSGELAFNADAVRLGDLTDAQLQATQWWSRSLSVIPGSPAPFMSTLIETEPALRAWGDELATGLTPDAAARLDYAPSSAGLLAWLAQPTGNDIPILNIDPQVFWSLGVNSLSQLKNLENQNNWGVLAFGLSNQQMDALGVGDRSITFAGWDGYTSLEGISPQMIAELPLNVFYAGVSAHPNILYALSADQCDALTADQVAVIKLLKASGSTKINLTKMTALPVAVNGINTTLGSVAHTGVELGKLSFVQLLAWLAIHPADIAKIDLTKKSPAEIALILTPEIMGSLSLTQLWQLNAGKLDLSALSSDQFDRIRSTAPAGLSAGTTIDPTMDTGLNQASLDAIFSKVIVGANSIAGGLANSKDLYQFTNWSRNAASLYKDFGVSPVQAVIWGNSISFHPGTYYTPAAKNFRDYMNVQRNKLQGGRALGSILTAISSPANILIEETEKTVQDQTKDWFSFFSQVMSSAQVPYALFYDYTAQFRAELDTATTPEEAKKVIDKYKLRAANTDYGKILDVWNPASDDPFGGQTAKTIGSAIKDRVTHTSIFVGTSLADLDKLTSIGKPKAVPLGKQAVYGLADIFSIGSSLAAGAAANLDGGPSSAYTTARGIVPYLQALAGVPVLLGDLLPASEKLAARFVSAASYDRLMTGLTAFGTIAGAALGATMSIWSSVDTYEKNPTEGSAINMIGTSVQQGLNIALLPIAFAFPVVGTIVAVVISLVDFQAIGNLIDQQNQQSDMKLIGLFADAQIFGATAVHASELESIPLVDWFYTYSTDQQQIDANNLVVDSIHKGGYDLLKELLVERNINNLILTDGVKQDLENVVSWNGISDIRRGVLSGFSLDAANNNVGSLVHKLLALNTGDVRYRQVTSLSVETASLHDFYLNYKSSDLSNALPVISTPGDYVLYTYQNGAKVFCDGDGKPLFDQNHPTIVSNDGEFSYALILSTFLDGSMSVDIGVDETQSTQTLTYDALSEDSTYIYSGMALPPDAMDLVSQSVQTLSIHSAKTLLVNASGRYMADGANQNEVIVGSSISNTDVILQNLDLDSLGGQTSDDFRNLSEVVLILGANDVITREHVSLFQGSDSDGSVTDRYQVSASAANKTTIHAADNIFNFLTFVGDHGDWKSVATNEIGLAKYSHMTYIQGAATANYLHGTQGYLIYNFGGAIDKIDLVGDGNTVTIGGGSTVDLAGKGNVVHAIMGFQTATSGNGSFDAHEFDKGNELDFSLSASALDIVLAGERGTVSTVAGAVVKDTAAINDFQIIEGSVFGDNYDITNGDGYMLYLGSGANQVAIRGSQDIGVKSVSYDNINIDDNGAIGSAATIWSYDNGTINLLGAHSSVNLFMYGTGDALNILATKLATVDIFGGAHTINVNSGVIDLNLHSGVDSYTKLNESWHGAPEEGDINISGSLDSVFVSLDTSGLHFHNIDSDTGNNQYLDIFLNEGNVQLTAKTAVTVATAHLSLSQATLMADVMIQALSVLEGSVPVSSAGMSGYSLQAVQAAAGTLGFSPIVIPSRSGG